MRISVSTCLFNSMLWKEGNHYPPIESISRCAKAGYRVMEMDWGVYSLHDSPFGHDGWQAMVRQVVEVSKALGIECSTAHAHFFNPSGLSDADKIHLEHLIHETIVASGMIGASIVVMHPLTACEDGWYSHKDSLRFNTDYFARYGALASTYGMKLAIENMIESPHYRRYCSSTEELLELIDTLNDDKTFGICWDTGHANLSKVDQCAALSTIGPERLIALHIADNRGQFDDHLAPYWGTIEWEPIMAMLKTMGYRGDFTLEIHKFLNGLPDALHDRVASLTHDIATYLLSL